MDWIDKEYINRKNGRRRMLYPSEHDAVNSRYPGCTLEYCCKCDRPTGNAGKVDGSLYTDADGPFCYQCFYSIENHIEVQSCPEV